MLVKGSMESCRAEESKKTLCSNMGEAVQHVLQASTQAVALDASGAMKRIKWQWQLYACGNGSI